MTSDTLDFFISHSSKDTIAQALFTLLGDEVYGGDVAEIKRRVFFSSNGEVGLSAGENFETLLDRVNSAKRVVALVTLTSCCSPAVQTEMVHALHRQALIPVVARKEYRSLLKWPFDRLNTLSLDSPGDVRSLMMQLGQVAGRDVPGRNDARYARLADEARRSCPKPPPPQRWWRVAAITLVALLIPLIGIAFFVGKGRAAPRAVTVGTTKEEVIDGTSIMIIHRTTFPRKRLSSRLHEIHATLGLNDVSHTEVHDLFMTALRATNQAWGLTTEQLGVLEGIVTQWRSGGSQVEFASDTGCNALPVTLDQAWCTAVEGLFSQGTRGDFDNTEFAIARLGPEASPPPRPLTVLTVRTPVPGHPRWTVEDIGAVTLRVEP